ncbi:MAG: formate dehydrogenase [Casimicrobium sp.]
MSDSKRNADLKRRGFLLAGSVGAVGAAAVVVAPSIKQVPAAAAKVPAPGERYVGGERAQQYYDTTRV